VVSVPRTRPPYPEEFRREAVELVRQGRSVADVAESLGVSQQTLRNWTKQVDVEAGRRVGLTSEDREELKQLRRRVRVLEQEREILKKAAAFFAKENGTR
jgi:transposase